ncbi:MAG: hypothetical protein HAW67_07410 [Endozoicomonadaceae bacterium]|nr:hypothetical protein [Endozoicomonadaceae bacterium]
MPKLSIERLQLRVNALTTASELIRQTGEGSDEVFDNLENGTWSEREGDIYIEECKRLALKLDREASKLQKQFNLY